MHIIHIAAELAPIAKVGGLADVVFGLSRATLKLGHTVQVMIPKYDIINFDEVKDCEYLAEDLTCLFEGKEIKFTIIKGTVEGIDTLFLDTHHPRMFYSRGCVYGSDDDIDRFLFFCQASIKFLQSHKAPDIIHLHDWQTAVIAPLVKSKTDLKSKVVLTIHNLEHQGLCKPYEMEKVGLDSATYYTPDQLQDFRYPEAANLMKGGILYADMITTVSPTYAEEVKSGGLGEGLESLFSKNEDKFIGILNGIDYGYWDPETDPYLPAHYSYNKVSNKGFLKRKLRERLELEQAQRPIVSSICRLVPQKGIDIIKHAIDSSVDMGCQFVLLGSSPIPLYNDQFHAIKHTYRDHPHVSINLKHEEVLAHLIYAGSDILIAPSRFEPCGLTQLIALRYGTVPLVRQTGGLADTIYDVDASEKSAEKRNGFSFKEPTPEAFDKSLRRAYSLWYNHPDQWRQLVTTGMSQDFSWNQSTQKYIKMYQKLCTS